MNQADVNGTTADSTYTPTVSAGPPVHVVIPKSALRGTVVVLDLPASTPDLVSDSIRLLDADGNEVLTLVVPGEGTWVVDQDTGEVTFTPEPGFTGNPTPVDFVGVLDDGTPVTGVLEITYYAPGLASTGAEGVAWLSGLGLLLAAGGGSLVLAARARRRSSGV